MQETLSILEPFKLENGAVLPGITIQYTTYGTKKEDDSNVAWICHALTANADPVSWWPGLVGEGFTIDPAKHFIVCANIIGSCYGSSGPLSPNPAIGTPYYSQFPQVTIRDMVKAHILLRQHLGIKHIHLLMGGSMGGYQVLEWCLMEPSAIDNIFLIATSAAESAWGIAIHTAQRLAIEADGTWKEDKATAGQKGLKAARAVGMLTYRNYTSMVKRQHDADTEKLDGFRASSYIDYQGDKLVQRFNAQSYWLLTKSMDSHNIARGRNNSIEKVLSSIQQKALVIGISSDILCPPHEQLMIAEHLPYAFYHEIDSIYGHDGFLVEAPLIGEKLAAFLAQTVNK